MRIKGDNLALENAARWLRRELNIPVECTVFDEFEKYFNCKLQVDDRKDYWMMPDFIEFESEQAVIMFMLRWS